jgi:signal transduction histidine kinase
MSNNFNIRAIIFLFGLWFLIPGFLSAQLDEPQVFLEKIKLAPADSLKDLISKAETFMYRNPLQGKQFVDQLLIRSKELNDTDNFAYVTAIKGIYFFLTSDKDSCFLAFNQALSHIPELQNNELKFMIINLYARVNSQYHQFDSAAAYLEKAEQLALLIDKPKFYAAYYNNMGILASDLGKLYESFTYYMQALHYFSEMDDKNNMAVLNNNIGRINQRLDDHETAIEYFTEAMAINRIYGDVFDLGMNYGNIGISYKALEKYEKALEAYTTAYSIANENGFKQEMARALLNSADVYLLMGDTAAAEENFLNSLEISTKNNVNYGIILNNLNLASLYLEKYELDKAWTHINDAEKLASSLKEFELLNKIFDVKVKVLKEKSNFKEALFYREKYLALNDSLSELAKKQQLMDLKTKYDAEKKSLENQQLRIENENINQIVYWRTLFLMVLVILLIILFVFIINIRKSRKKIETVNAELQALNSKITEQNKELRDSNMAKDKLLSVIGHDLRSPFNSMLGLLQLMTSEFETFEKNEQKEILQTLLKQAGDTYQTVENLLQWALSQGGKINCKPRRMNLLDIAMQEVTFLNHRAEAKEIKLVNQIDSDTFVLADKELMLIIFRNLINNAIKFSTTGQEITIRNHKQDNWQILEVVDKGLGMQPQQVRAILSGQHFESTKGTENEGGTGLGLQLIKEFIRLQKGIFEVESEPGLGSTFRVWMPAAD